MIDKIKSRLASESGFTLIELLVVIIIIGILVAIAVPSYLGFKDRANEAAAKANTRSAVPAAESYYQTHSNSYTGLTGALLQAEAPGVSADVTAGPSATGTAYCIEDTTNAVTYHYEGGSVTGAGVATVASGSCPAGYTLG